MSCHQDNQLTSAPSTNPTQLKNSATSSAQLGQLVTNFGAGGTRLLNEEVAAQSDVLTAELNKGSEVAAYFAQPRIIVTAQMLTATNGQSATASQSIDLLQDAIRVIAFPGQAANAPYNFNVVRGFTENGVESTLGALGSPSGTSVTSSQVFIQAGKQGITLALLNGAGDITRLGTFGLDPDSTARIVAALQAGQIVLVPTAPVIIGREADDRVVPGGPDNGLHQRVLSSGQHGFEWSVVLNIARATLIGAAIGITAAAFDSVLLLYVRKNFGEKAAKQVKKGETDVATVIATFSRQIAKPILFEIIAASGAFIFMLNQLSFDLNIDPTLPSELWDESIPQPTPSNLSQITESSVATRPGGNTNGSATVAGGALWPVGRQLDVVCDQ